ncbi:hypothetical protein [uncultured Desulfosarcina sp.]|uniref:hypothetical protein n=1 Tax=uncultured Desulfosarcina sp. TaxID=218289 RepID=UPI0029C87AF2|nr:hypothetical protein [uncultured Desulfosarcina sp.]
MKKLVGIFAVLLALFLFGCVNNLQSKYAWSDKLYSGPYKAKERIAILVQNERQRVHLSKINGRKIKKELGVVFELLPGEYSLCLELAFIKGYTKYDSEECQSVELNAEPGHTYEFYEILGDTIWHPGVRDITAELQNPDMEPLNRKINSMLSNARSKHNQ